MGKVKVLAAAASTDPRTVGHRTVLILQFAERFIPTMSWVDVQHHNSARCTRGDSNVGLWEFFPPGANPRVIGGGVFDAFNGERMLSGVGAILVGATTMAIFRPIKRDNGPTAPGTAQCHIYSWWKSTAWVRISARFLRLHL